MLDLKNVTKKFSDTIAVNNISFSVGKGEVVGFLGPNGAGKTTTMRLLTGFLRPDMGEVRIGDVDPAKERVEAVKMIGYLPENNPLYGEMKVGEYLYFIGNLKFQAPNMSHRQSTEEVDNEQTQNPISKSQNRSKIQNPKPKKSINRETEHSSKINYPLQRIAKKCGIEDKLGSKIENLSRGYKQRVGLAAALLRDPPVLIMDEPTSGLDPNQVIKIREMIGELGKKKTVVLSTHILQEVEAVCTRVIIIDRGRIVYDGKVPKKKGKLEEQFREVTVN